ncbi:MAG: SDR family oxidoreductase [Firmicutes bacterium]|nr:SDR family oxidoreductase [Bacillota bacterium]
MGLKQDYKFEPRALYPELKGKRVVVTGGASGIGLATVKRFVLEGAKVVIFDYNDKVFEQLKAEIPQLAGTVKVDVSSEESVDAAFKEMDEILGGIDILISNAGISIRKKFIDTDFSQWKRVLGINLDGMALCIMQALRRMKEEKTKDNTGVILCTASTNGMCGHPYYTDYNASKAAVIELVRSVAIEHAPWVRCNCICPGYVLTPMQEAEYTQEMFDEVNKGIPLERHADPAEVAALYAFLASDEAKYITGQHIPLDGGETA